MGKEDNDTTKLARFRVDGQVHYGVVEGGHVREISGDVFGSWQRTEMVRSLDAVEILVPTQPSAVIALAGNYRDHLGDVPVPETPMPFFKLPSSLLPSGGQIIQPSDHDGVHYEAELVVVIGRHTRKVSTEDAKQHVLGITCGNDVSARDWQANDRQWWRAKGSDTFGPCGPFIAVGLDYNQLDVELRVNGEVRQKTNTKNMIHSVDETISFISRYVTLQPGDLVFTGTPGKTKSMAVGDHVEVEIEGVGVLTNQLIAE